MRFLSLLLLAVSTLAMNAGMEESLRSLGQSIAQMQANQELNRQKVCLGEHTHPGAHLDRIRKGDCEGVLSIIRSGTKANAKIHFSRDSSRGYQIPTIFRYRTCLVGIDFPHPYRATITPEMEDDSTFEELAMFVEAIVELCVNRPGSEGFGGRVLFGDNSRMKVAVQGTSLDEDDKGREYYASVPSRRLHRQAAGPPAPPAAGSSPSQSLVFDMQMQGHIEELRRLVQGMGIPHVPSSSLLDPPPPSGLQRSGSMKRSVVNPFEPRMAAYID